MKLRFSWNRVGALEIPVCEEADTKPGAISPLSCLLMDDGGQELDASSKYLDLGVQRVDQVLAGALLVSSWDRDAWGARLSRSEVEIYSLYDDDCSDRVSLVSFRQALVEWGRFIESSCRSPMDVIV